MKDDTPLGHNGRSATGWIFMKFQVDIICEIIGRIWRDLNSSNSFVRIKYKY